MTDLYSDFAELAAKEVFGVDYRYSFEDRGSPIIILAPHGGSIEPGTSAIAKAIAGNELSIYIFEGLRDRSRELHITSINFDEPKCLKLVTGAQTAIAIHGRKDGDDPTTVSVGGLNGAMGNAITSSLEQAGFQAAPAAHRLAGRDVANICNRGSSGVGVQLELPRSLRDQLVHDDVGLHAFSDAVREAILLTQNEKRVPD